MSSTHNICLCLKNAVLYIYTYYANDFGVSKNFRLNDLNLIDNFFINRNDFNIYKHNICGNT